MGFTGQSNTFDITVMAFPFFTINLTFQGILNLFGTVTILEPGASVDIFATGSEIGTIAITRHFENTATFSLVAFGNLNPSTLAIDRLVVVINGAASFSGGTIFRGTVPEPTTILLLGSGLAGIAVKMRKKLRRDKNVT